MRRRARLFLPVPTLAILACVATTATAEGPGVPYTDGLSVTSQPDGKIVVAGALAYKDAAFAVARYQIDGDLDSGFGTGGSTSTDIPASSAYGWASAVAVGADGKIVAAGTAHNGLTYDYAVARYNADGSIDTGFGGVGFVQTDLGNVANEYSSDVAIQSDGRVLVTAFNTYLLRYTVAGALDPDFGTGGIVTLSLAGYDQLEVLADDRIVLVGNSGTNTDNIQIVRLEPDGDLDVTFSDDGIATTTATNQGAAFGVHTDGKVVVALSNGLLLQFTADGDLDPTFDTDGVLFPSPLEWIETTPGVLVRDGKITVFGSDQQHDPPIVLARFDSTGALDATFGDGGLAELPFVTDSYYDDVYRMALQPDGHIVLVGRLGSFEWADFVMRLNADGSLDTAFGENGKLHETQCRNVPLDSPSCIDAATAKARFCIKHPYWWYTLYISNWKWRGLAPESGPIASGADSTYTVCVYDMHSGTPELVRPVDGSWDRWSPVSNGWKLHDEDQYYWGELTDLKVLAPAGRAPSASAQLHAVFPQYDDKHYFDADPGIIVQLVNSDGLCWKSTFSGAEIRQNDETCFKAKK